MENLNKTQLILLALLVSFFTSLITGIVAVSLMNQAPPPLTQTISRVIEKVVPATGQQDGQKQAENPLVLMRNQENLVVGIIDKFSSAVVSVIATKDLPVIEQYFVNPFGQDEFFRNLIPPELLPNFQIPQYRQKGTENRQVSSGTGFFISPDGFIATNKHVVADKNAEYWIITNNGRKLKAKVFALDPIQDVAILKIDASASSNYNYIPLGDSDNLKVGQTVIAIGNALGEFQNTVSVGVISGLNRSVAAGGASSEGKEILRELIQTDAAINPGNSGGPLLGLDGKAIGINTAMARGAENVGFALPIGFVKKDLADVKESGKIKYAYLGVRYLMINAQIQDERKLSVDYGALLIKGEKGESPIMANSPGEKMGLKEGDIILEFNGVKVNQSNALSSLIGNRRVGQKVSLKVLRDNQTLNISGTLEVRPDNL